jgi:integrase
MVRELIANALVHQDLSISGTSVLVEIFDNRLEVSSPGHSIIPIDRLVNEVRSRNEIFAEFMRRMGVCEERGSEGVLSAIFTAAKDWRPWDGDNPTRGVRIGRKRLVREKRLLAVEELRALIAALAERPRFIVLIIFGLGLRISEVLGLRWKDIDFERKTATIRRRWYSGDLSEERETKSEASAATLRISASMLAE